ncbi:MAG: glycosyltransferase [Rhodospirillaceae bacterium]|nr:glycosyltransferase [Rhodospirillaceae bacterium]
MTPQRLGIGWQVGVQSGWGVYGVNLALELAKRGIAPEIFFTAANVTLRQDQAPVLGPHLERQRANSGLLTTDGILNLDYPFLHALSDKLGLPGTLARVHGKPDIGVVFFESATIPHENIAHAKRFAVIIAGSSWNAEVMRAHGLTNVRNCPQGVDLEVFAPGPRQKIFGDRFVVFAGGKLEYRKGQDLTVAAFKRFHAKHPDALLVSAWHSPWPQLAQTLSNSIHLEHGPAIGANGQIDIAGWFRANGIADDGVVDLGAFPNLETPYILREVDVALLPSRCEGGTNLVAMECMACGVPVILSRNTGHLDLIQADNCYPLDLQIPIGAVTGQKDREGWGESSIEEIVVRLEEAYTNRAELAKRGAAAAKFMTGWGWSAQVGHFVAAISEFIS